MAINCPVCKTSIVLIDGRIECPRCDFWKTSYGQQWWEKHSTNVKHLLTTLESRFPQVTWIPGLGALSGKRLDMAPTETNEPDLIGLLSRIPVCMIEVSGTDSKYVKVPPEPILIRPGKIAHASTTAPDGHYYFWMVYEATRSTLVVPITIANDYYRNRVPKQIRGRVETYCAIPSSLALEPSYLFESITARLAGIQTAIVGEV